MEIFFAKNTFGKSVGAISPSTQKAPTFWVFLSYLLNCHLHPSSHKSHSNDKRRTSNHSLVHIRNRHVTAEWRRRCTQPLRWASEQPQPCAGNKVLVSLTARSDVMHPRASSSRRAAALATSAAAAPPRSTRCRPRAPRRRSTTPSCPRNWQGRALSFHHCRDYFRRSRDVHFSISM